jgi:DNA-binding XRE family transcriptional regulator/desulfoferrodoxin (superoxide reductase-like protein)
MDNAKIGNLIYQLRKEKNMTQLQLAEKLGISDKAVSKWERGLGSPDLSLMPKLSEIFGVDLEKLLTGEMPPKKTVNGNMKRMLFYVCPDCGNMITAMADANISCCGKIMTAIKPQKSDEWHKLNVEIIETDYYLTTAHPMERDHYITFVALITADGLTMKKLYPQWDMQARIPFRKHGRLVWHCSKDGLFYMDI